MAQNVDIRGRSIPVCMADTFKGDPHAARRVTEDMPAFRQWLERTSAQSDYTVDSITIDTIDCPPVPQAHAAVIGVRPGFAAMKVAAVCPRSGIRIPPLVLLRGRAISVLVIVSYQNDDYVVLTVAPRFAVAQPNFAEIPSGTFDPQGNFVGQSAQELKEEGGLVGLHKADMVELNDGESVHTAPHATDESVALWLYRRTVTREWLSTARKGLTGKRSEGDSMTLLLSPLSEAWRRTSDARSLAALVLYERLKAAGRVPAQTISNRF